VVGETPRASDNSLILLVLVVLNNTSNCLLNEISQDPKVKEGLNQGNALSNKVNNKSGPSLGSVSFRDVGVSAVTALIIL
jgi:hypothetical protein